jgi:hypothetical protein
MLIGTIIRNSELNIVKRLLTYAVKHDLEDSVSAILENYAQTVSNRTLRDLIKMAPRKNPSSIVEILSSVLNTRPSLLRTVQSGNIPSVTQLLDAYPGMTLWDDDWVKPQTVFEASILTWNVALLDSLIQHYEKNFLLSPFYTHLPTSREILPQLLKFAIPQGTLPLFTYLLNHTNRTNRLFVQSLFQSLFLEALKADNTKITLFLIEASLTQENIVIFILQNILLSNKLNLIQHCIGRYIYPEDFINPGMVFMPISHGLLFKKAFLSIFQKKSIIRMSDDAFFEQEADIVIQMTDIAVQEFLKETVAQYGTWQLEGFLTLVTIPFDPNSPITVEDSSKETEKLPLDTEIQYSRLTIDATPNTLQKLYSDFADEIVPDQMGQNKKKTYIFHRKHPTNETKHLICFVITPTSFTCFIPSSRVPYLVTTEDCLNATRAAYKEAWLQREEAEVENLEACKHSFETTLWQKGLFWVFPTHTNVLQDKRVALCQKTYYEALEHDTGRLFPKQPLALTWRP